MSGLENEIRELAGDYLRKELSIAEFRARQVNLMSRALAANDRTALEYIADEIELLMTRGKGLIPAQNGCTTSAMIRSSRRADASH